MSVILQRQSPGLAGSFSDQYGECCPPVLDPYTLLALIGGIALATFFLQQVIVMTMFGRKKRSAGMFEDTDWMTKALDELLTMNDELSDPDPDILSMTGVSRNTSHTQMPGQCRSEVWHCMSEVMEGGVKYVNSPGDIYRAVQPVLYKAVFHGGLKSMWSSVMEVGEMRRMGRCVQDHDHCVEHSILSQYL